jgi:hypothetical protein
MHRQSQAQHQLTCHGIACAAVKEVILSRPSLEWIIDDHQKVSRSLDFRTKAHLNCAHDEICPGDSEWCIMVYLKLSQQLAIHL